MSSGRVLSNATVNMLAKAIHALEKMAQERFLSSGRKSDAEEWHKVRIG